MTEENKISYAGFWPRLGAQLIDFLVMLPYTFFAIWLGENYRLSQLILFVPGCLFGLWLHVYLVKVYGGTPGKLALKLKIRKLDGSPADFREAFLRYSVGFVLSTLLTISICMVVLQMTDSEYFSYPYFSRALVISRKGFAQDELFWLTQLWLWSEFIVMFSNKKRRAIHDYIAGTIVSTL